MSNRLSAIIITVFFALIALSNNANSKSKIFDFTSEKAPEIVGIEKWLNGDAVKITDLKGKVILIDFWTYSCINCIRTLPYIKAWDEKYRDKGLVIIGVHSPEFAFEKNSANVEKAIKKFGIKYRVALDNEMQTWQNYKNQYWPAHYLINQEGDIVYTHFGEGQYDEMEKQIVNLLKVSKQPKSQTKYQKPSFFTNQTHEIYLGYKRGTNNVNQSLQKLVFPNDLPKHSWALQGNWKITDEFIESAASNASIKLNFISKKVFLVMASANNESEVKAEIFLNGKKVNSDAGLDSKNGFVTIKEAKLYELVNQKENQNSILEIRTQNKGLRAYAFTFGDL